ncbi:MAG: hypothetical protein PHT91_00285 [Candidatus Nanoarchaeia archaeon]|nr:hypothetical protein [Candidatus Nanoarchaeia archaeon]MDD5499298.1 hypothetical protein [Candidatus Nanoarchaeia archaeon]
MVKPKNSFKFYAMLALFLSLLVFLSGFSIGFLVNDFKQKSISSDLSNIMKLIESNEVEIALMNFLDDEISCEYLNLRVGSINQEVHELGLRVSAYEGANSVLTEEYYSIKKSYINALINNWINVEKARNLCSLNYSTILYLYALKEDCPRCEEQVYALSRIKSQYGIDSLIYSIDTTLGLEAVNMLMYSYNISAFPSLVINGKTHSGYASSQRIRELMGQ